MARQLVCRSSREPNFGSLRPHMCLQQSVTPSPGDGSDALFCLREAPDHTYMYNTHKHMNADVKPHFKISKKKKSCSNQISGKGRK